MKKSKILICGRTMVEMLAVIGIIGILTSGSIITYQVATTKKTTTDIMNYISLLSLEVLSKKNNYTNENCSNFVLTLKKPVLLDSCMVTSNVRKACVNVNVTYYNASQKLKSALFERSNDNIHVSENAATFTVGVENSTDCP